MAWNSYNSSSQPYPKDDRKLSTPKDMDGVSSLSWSPKRDIMVATTWCKRALAWEVSNNGQTRAVGMFTNSDPILASDFSGDGTRVFLGCADGSGKMWNPETKQAQMIAKHDSAIKCIKWCSKINVVATAGWDRKLKYWDCRKQSPVATVDLPERAYAMDVMDDVMVIGCARRQITIFNLSNPGKIFKQEETTLKNQIRCVACFPSGKKGYAAGSICGRVAINYLMPGDQGKNFMFKCHRQKDKGVDRVFAVNAIEFYPRGTFATAGSDGQFVFWDKDSRQRLKKFDLKFNNTISCCKFNTPGNKFAYAVSYDWSKGMHHYANKENQIFLHPVNEKEIKPQQRS